MRRRGRAVVTEEETRVLVSVEFLAQAKVAAGEARCEVELADAATPRELLRQLVERRPTMAPLAGCNGEAVPLLLFVGNEQVDWDDGRPLRDGDRVLITSPMSGG